MGSLPRLPISVSGTSYSMGASVDAAKNLISLERHSMAEKPLPIAIYYEQPNWFKPLFAELDRRGTEYVKLDAVTHSYSPAGHPEEQYALVFNRMSPSAWNRGHGDQIFYTTGFLEHLEARGVKVLNGLAAFRSELSKAGQLSLMEELDIPYPKARVIHRPAQAAAATEGLRWPIVVKPNIGGSGAGVKRFDGLSQLRHAMEAQPGSENALQFGLDSTALVQEFIPAEGAHIVRVEVLNGKFLYAIKVHITGETFDLCPADICRTTTGTDLNRAACAIDAPKSGITVEAYTPPADAIADVETIMKHSGIDIGGVEYITDSRDHQRYYYDTNALSNFVADGPNVIGFDPFAKLVDWLEAEAGLEASVFTGKSPEEQQALAAGLTV
jgi:glutathione synthase/RimK-type ligase-like ATP-grasp enzyme